MKYAYNKVNKIQNVWNFALCTILNAHSIPTTYYRLLTTDYLLPITYSLPLFNKSSSQYLSIPVKYSCLAGSNGFKGF